MTAALLLALAVAAWFSWRYAWWRPATDERCPRILMYHMISPPRPGGRFNGLRVSPRLFERQLRWLQQQGWHSFTVGELLQQGERLPPRSFAITFDDGYADNLLQALPLLQKYDCKATLYLVVERFGRDWSVQRKAHHDSGELREEPKLSDQQVRELLASGRIELGSHSLTHANFLRLDAEAASRELGESRARLQQTFGVAVDSFAWPFGLYRPEQVALAAQAGYRSAVTVQEGIDDPRSWKPLELRRIKISGRDGWLAFRLRLRGGRRGWR
ncbi:MAG TPA: polysaccharide deacetylase family protein [Gammaproteobacteria bacterium]|nr:polysaccharide deacetylase family protein [Gammaproteobacteria bacterium]